MFKKMMDFLQGKDMEDEYEDDFNDGGTLRDLRDVREFRRTKSLEEYTICVMTPKSHTESPKIADALKKGWAVILNMENFDQAEEKKKMFHFATGVIYTIEGEIKNITENVFVITPETVRIDEDFINTQINPERNEPWRKMEPIK